MVEPRFITFEDLCACHEEALRLDPNSRPGILSQDLLEGACGSALHQFDYCAEYLDECAGYAYLAAHYWTRVAENHGFNDANNRTASICALTFLRMNGYGLDMTGEGVKELGGSIARRELDCEAVALVLAPRLKAL